MKTSMIVMTFCVVALSGTAAAQMDNRPFTFGFSGKGIGLSPAARQAIIDKEIRGSTPNNLLRNPGNLGRIKRGTGGLAIIVDRHGEHTVRQTGRPASLGRAGDFNSFSVKFDGLPYLPEMGTSSGGMVDGWTGSVHGYVTVGGNSVDQWTSMVHLSR